MKNPLTGRLNRRDFLKIGATAGVGAALAKSGLAGAPGAPPPGSPAAGGATLIEFKVPPVDPVRIGFVGVGGMGSAHVRNFLKIDGVEIKAVCDIVEEKTARIQKWCEEAGRPKPEAYFKGEWDFKRLCERPDLDLVYNVTPWEWHVPVCLAAMQAGKHAATEVPAAYTIEDCWKLVETAEKTKRHCVMMENCCYDRPEMLCLNLVKKGLLGEIFHAEAGYLHDLREVKFNGAGESLWRPQHSVKRNGNIYPTHGLGPVSQCLDINRGDRFSYLVSMSSKSLGLHLYAEKKFGPDGYWAKQKFVLGDVNVCLIHTAGDKVITLYHDTSSPRPYSRIDIVQGTKGIFEKYPDRVHIEGRSPNDQWETLDSYYLEHDHPVWKELEARSKGAGHGGMDFIEDYRLVEAMRQGRPLDFDVYDGVSWSVVTPLSEWSVAKKSRPADFPDFTRGQWKNPRTLHVMEVKA
jgi:predicted dehydrogenase